MINFFWFNKTFFLSFIYGILNDKNGNSSPEFLIDPSTEMTDVDDS